MVLPLRTIRLSKIPLSCRSRSLLTCAREERRRWSRVNSLLHREFSSKNSQLNDLRRSWTPFQSSFAYRYLHTSNKVYQQRQQQNPKQPEADEELPELDFDPSAPLDWRKWSSRMKGIVVLLMGGSMYYVAHLERVPETGRWRFINILPKHEKKLAEKEYSEFLEEFKGKLLPQSHPVVQEVRRIVLAIIEANNLGSLKASDQASYVPAAAQKSAQEDGAEANWDPDALSPGIDLSADRGTEGVATRQWNLLVVDDDSVVNAAAGHGNIIVFTGILPVAKDEQGLAAILSHEMAHVVLRHKAETMSSALVLSSLVYLLSFLGLDANIGELLLSYLYTLPNSRTMELEADKIGLRLSAKACFEPGAAPEVQRRLAISERNKRLNVEFLYTHPTGAKRVKLLIDELPEAYSIRAGSSACAIVQENYGAFKNAVDMLDISDIPMA